MANLFSQKSLPQIKTKTLYQMKVWYEVLFFTHIARKNAQKSQHQPFFCIVFKGGNLKWNNKVIQKK